MLKRFGVVQQFAIRSLIFVVIMGLLLGLSITLAVRSLFVSQAAQTARVTANAIVLTHLEGVDITNPVLPADTTAELDRMTRDHLVDADISTVKLWNPDGVLLYSSDGERIGESFSEHPPFLTARDGGVKVDIEDKARPENELQIQRDGRVIEVYAPLIRAGEVIGVFEIYRPYAPVASTINDFLAIVWLIIILGSVPAYFLQLTIVKRTADELTAAKSDLGEVNRRLTDSLEEMELHSLGTLQALVAAVDAKDSYTARHSIAVTDYAVAIARRLGLTEREITDVERAGLLHDVGKIGTPESILLKPDRLTDEEYTVITEHAEASGHIVEAVPFLARLTPVIRGHHERWDGKGYPDGLIGERIPLLSRILVVADAFDAMTSERPYRSPISVEVARAELVRCAGTQFDPAVVQALITALDAGDATVVVHAEAARARRRKVAATASA